MNKYSLRLKRYSDNANSALRECQRTEYGIPQGVVVETMHYRLLDAVKWLRTTLARRCAASGNASAGKSEVKNPETRKVTTGKTAVKKRAAKGTDDE